MLGRGMNSITRNHITGFVVGVGVAATGYYVYMKNKDKVDEFLANHGVYIPKADVDNLKEASLEDLVIRKETLEDLIAEKEMHMETVIVEE